MTKQQALAEAWKRWGATAAIKTDPHAPDTATRTRAVSVRAALAAAQNLPMRTAAQLATRRAQLDACRPQARAVLEGAGFAPTSIAKRVDDLLLSLLVVTRWYPFTVGRHIGIGMLTEGRGDSWEDAFRDADAWARAKARKPSKAPVVPLQGPKKAATLPQERRSRGVSTPSIPPATPTTKTIKVRSTHTTKAIKAPYTEGPTTTQQASRRCADCGVEIPKRTRCNRCALQQWRATHPGEKRAQDQRYREANTKHVRTLVRARVAKWRARQRTQPTK